LVSPVATHLSLLRGFVLLLIALLIFLLLTNWLFSELFALLPLQIFDGLSYGFGWIALGVLFWLGSWFFGE
jgi:hypothetical protein